MIILVIGSYSSRYGVNIVCVHVHHKEEWSCVSVDYFIDNKSEVRGRRRFSVLGALGLDGEVGAEITRVTHD